MDVFYTVGSNLLVFCAGCTQPKLVEQVWELHKQSVFILMLDFSCQRCLCDPRFGSGGSIVIFMLEKPR